ncbi:hypothetical protein GC207_15695 [bacterium]|nr:hypothetical protein [bacterium]
MWIAPIAIASNPTTSACENIIVEYGNGAAPRNKASVVTKALRGATCFDSHANSAAPPNADMIPIDPAQATQLDVHKPIFESASMLYNDKAHTAKTKGGRAKATVPGALSE